MVWTRLFLVPAMVLMAVWGWATPARAAQWTVMVYMIGDNNLEESMVGKYGQFQQMARVGSDSNINIVVQLDRAKGFVTDPVDDWTTCKRFRITQGMAPTPANALADLGEVNM